MWLCKCINDEAKYYRVRLLSYLFNRYVRSDEKVNKIDCQSLPVSPKK